MYWVEVKKKSWTVSHSLRTRTICKATNVQCQFGIYMAKALFENEITLEEFPGYRYGLICNDSSSLLGSLDSINKRALQAEKTFFIGLRLDVGVNEFSHVIRDLWRWSVKWSALGTFPVHRVNISALWLWNLKLFASRILVCWNESFDVKSSGTILLWDWSFWLNLMTITC